MTVRTAIGVNAILAFWKAALTNPVLTVAELTDVTARTA